MGWLIAMTSGLLPAEHSKLKRRLVRDCFQKLQPNVYCRSCVPSGRLAQWAGKIRNYGAHETSVRLIWLTRKQWELSWVIQGEPQNTTGAE